MQINNTCWNRVFFFLGMTLSEKVHLILEYLGIDFNKCAATCTNETTRNLKEINIVYFVFYL